VSITGARPHRSFPDVTVEGVLPELTDRIDSDGGGGDDEASVPCSPRAARLNDTGVATTAGTWRADPDADDRPTQRVNESTSQRVNESTSQRVNESTSQRVNEEFSAASIDG